MDREIVVKDVPQAFGNEFAQSVLLVIEREYANVVIGETFNTGKAMEAYVTQLETRLPEAWAKIKGTEPGSAERRAGAVQVVNIACEIAASIIAAGQPALN